MLLLSLLLARVVFGDCHAVPYEKVFFFFLSCEMFHGTRRFFFGFTLVSVSGGVCEQSLLQNRPVHKVAIGGRSGAQKRLLCFEVAPFPWLSVPHA